MLFTVLISIKDQESLFCNYIMDQLSTTLSNFNIAQLGVLIQKHKHLYTGYVCFKVCDYLKGNTAKECVSENLTRLNEKFMSDISGFITRYVGWPQSEINDFFERLENILINTFLQNLVDATGVDIHDNRKYKLRNFEDSSFGVLSPSDRVLSLTYESEEIPLSGNEMVI